MKTSDFKLAYFLDTDYQKVSDNEFTATVIVYERKKNIEITRETVKIDFVAIQKQLSNSLLTLTPISWSTYLNATITMLFNLILIRFGISDSYVLNDKEKISKLFKKNPFIED